MDDVRANRAKLERLQDEVKRLEYSIRSAESSCSHAWSQRSEVRTVKEEHVDLTRPMYQGVHIDYPTVMINKQKTFWIRTCSVCGKVEETNETKLESVKVPAFKG